MGLAEQVGKIVFSLGPCIRSLRRTIYQGQEPGSHEICAIFAVDLVAWNTRFLLPESVADSPEDEGDEDNRTDNSNPRKNAISAQ